MPRSGTSLVEQIISSHNNVYGGGELAFLKNIIEDRFLINSKNENLNLAHFDKNILSEIQNEYIEKISQINNSDKAFTDKAPLNFRFIGFIKIIFPNSKIINCRRTVWIFVGQILKTILEKVYLLQII